MLKSLTVVALWIIFAGVATSSTPEGLGERIVNRVESAAQDSNPSHLKDHNIGVVYNLVKNPGFETADTKEPNWPAEFVARTTGRGNAENIKFTWEKSVQDKNKSIAIDARDVYLGYWETIVSVKPQKQYLISFRYKCGTGFPGSIREIYDRIRHVRPGGPNLELGVVSDNQTRTAKAKSWSDTEIPLGPRGGIYLPVVTEWSSFTQLVTTEINQNYMSIKLRMYCSTQKAWFDNLTVVELETLPTINIISPASNSLLQGKSILLKWKGPKEVGTYFVECSDSPLYVADRTWNFNVTIPSVRIPELRDEGFWYWRIGVPEQNGIPVWVIEGKFFVGNPQWISHDTTPPIINLPTPVPNAKANTAASITASFFDLGDGVEIKSAKVILDGKDLTKQAIVTEKGFTLKPTPSLKSGAHDVEVYVSDKAGNQSNRLTWRFGVDEALQYSIKIRDCKVLLNGKPYFPIGIWNYRCHPGDGRFDEGHLAAASAAGVDVLLNTIPPGLDILHKHRMKSLLNITYDLKQTLSVGGTVEAAKNSLFSAGNPNKGQAQFMNHPATLGYWADDPENIENTAGTPTPPGTIMTLNAAHDVLKSIDPDHPLVWAISNLPRLKDGGMSADIILSYRYPIPQYHPKVIDDFTLRSVSSVFPQKPIFFNSQAFDLASSNVEYADPQGMRPTVAEMRAMAYYAIVCGISGHTFYAPHLNKKDSPEHWDALLRIASEFRHLAPVLSGGRANRTVSQREDSTSGSIYFRESEYDGSHYLIAVNMSGGIVDTIWKFDKSKKIAVLFENRILRLPAKQIKDIFAPYDVHVYQWRN